MGMLWSMPQWRHDIRKVRSAVGLADVMTPLWD